VPTDGEAVVVDPYGGAPIHRGAERRQHRWEVKLVRADEELVVRALGVLDEADDGFKEAAGEPVEGGLPDVIGGSVPESAGVLLGRATPRMT
jgi:hypothetical protein